MAQTPRAGTGKSKGQFGRNQRPTVTNFVRYFACMTSPPKKFQPPLRFPPVYLENLMSEAGRHMYSATVSFRRGQVGGKDQAWRRLSLIYDCFYYLKQ